MRRGQITGALRIGACLTQAARHEIPPTQPCAAHGLTEMGFHGSRLLQGPHQKRPSLGHTPAQDVDIPQHGEIVGQSVANVLASAALDYSMQAGDRLL
jgi:hypothetical protein